MQEIYLGAQLGTNPGLEGLEPQEPKVAVIFDEKVKWGDLPFTVEVDSPRLTQFMRHYGMSDDAINEHKLRLHWSRSRTFLANYYRKEIEVNLNLFSDNKGRNQLSEVKPTMVELKDVESELNHNLHHEVGHAVSPEELKRGWIRRTILMFLGSLTLPEAAFLLKEMSTRRPSAP